ncbi:MAG: hypothetical protein WC815_05215 [Vicinamibacterales bacterium]
MRCDDGLRRGQFIVADRTNGRDAAANGACADARSSASPGACSGAGAGSDTHSNAGTNTNISDRKMGGRNA